MSVLRENIVVETLEYADAQAKFFEAIQQPDQEEYVNAQGESIIDGRVRFLSFNQSMLRPSTLYYHMQQQAGLSLALQKGGVYIDEADYKWHSAASIYQQNQHDYYNSDSQSVRQSIQSVRNPNIHMFNDIVWLSLTTDNWDNGATKIRNRLEGNPLLSRAEVTQHLQAFSHYLKHDVVSEGESKIIERVAAYQTATEAKIMPFNIEQLCGMASAVIRADLQQLGMPPSSKNSIKTF